MTPTQYFFRPEPPPRKMIQSIRKIITTRKTLKEYIGGTPTSTVLIFSYQEQYAYELASFNP